MGSKLVDFINSLNIQEFKYEVLSVRHKTSISVITDECNGVQCFFKGEPSDEYRDLSYSKSEGIDTFANGTLYIQNVAQSHEGYFLCQAKNEIGAGLSKLIRLTVHGEHLICEIFYFIENLAFVISILETVGPKVRTPQKQVSVRRNDHISIRCEAEGDQPLNISWQAKGNRIDPTYDIRYQLKNTPMNKGIVSELTILQSSLTDRGEYACIATNAYGQDHSIIYLQVQEPPSFPTNLHVTELGSRFVTLTWSLDLPAPTTMRGVHHYSQPITNYILQFKEAQDVWHDHNNQKMLPGDKTMAKITALKPSTNYHFRLYAANQLGTSAPSDVIQLQTSESI